MTHKMTQFSDTSIDNIHTEFQGITLKLQPGSKIALVGPSGGGKVIIFS